MGKLCCPAASFARAVSLQRANARAKSFRTEGINGSDEKLVDSQLSKRIDSMLTSISFSSINHAIQSKDGDDNDAGCGDDSNDVAASAPCSTTPMKRSLIRRSDIPLADFQPCLSTVSERIDRSLDLWDREFSSMSSYASDFEGFLCSLQRGIGSSSNGSFSKSKRENASSSSSSSTTSWSEAASFLHDDDHEEANCKLSGMSESCKLVTPFLHDDDNSTKACVDKTSTKGSFQLLEEEEIDIISKGGGCYYNTGKASSSQTGRCVKGDERIDEGGEQGNVSKMCGGAAAAAAELPANSVAVEKVTVHPEEDFKVSMYEMMLEKGDVEENMEELLDCYLLLNPAELHHMIREAFSHVWIDIIMSIR